MNIYYVIDEDQAYLEDGTKVVAPKAYTRIAANLPAFTYGNEYQVNWQNVTTKGEGLPSTWTKDTTYESVPLLATLVFDNNHLHCYRSILGEIEELDISNSESLSDSSEEPSVAINIIISNTNLHDIAKSGNILFVDTDGSIEKVNYISREKTPSGFKVYSVEGPQKTYADGTLIGIPESFYAQGVFNADNSDTQNGLFSFDVLFVSDKLNTNMLFVDTPYINIDYMAMRIISDDEDVEEVEYTTGARINNSVSGLRGLRFNESLYTSTGDIVFLLQESGVKIYPRGEYSEETTYAVDEAVSLNRSYYRSKVNDNQGNPVTDTDYWEMIFGGSYTIIPNPSSYPAVYDDTYGNCRYLEDGNNQLTFTDSVENLVRVKMTLLSANPAVTGNIALVPYINFEEQDAIYVPVGATKSTVTLDIPITSGRLYFVRDLEDELDTLNSDGTVTAIITNIIFEVDYA